MEDRLIWDLEAMQAMLMGLREASERLWDCAEDLRGQYAQGVDILGGNKGLSARLLDQLDALLRGVRRSGDRASDLADALARVRDMLAATENGLVRLAGGMAAGDGPRGRTASELSMPAPWPVYYMPSPRGTFYAVPPWLSSAADAALGR